MPVQRAMALACPDDAAAFAFEEQFFCGPDIFYLPKGRWRRFPDGDAVIEGGAVTTLVLELDEVAAFLRDGVEDILVP